MTTYEKIYDRLSLLDYDDLINIYNEYAYANSYEPIMVNDWDVLSDLFATTQEAVSAVLYGDYRMSDKYCVVNGYGNLDSFNYPDSDQSPLDLEALANWIEENEYFSDDWNGITFNIPNVYL